MLEIVPNTVDPDGSALLGFLDKEELARHLGRLSFFFFGPGSCHCQPNTRIRLLRWHNRNRCTMEVTMEADGVCRELIGKVYARDRSDVYRAMETLRRGGFCREAKNFIPQPLVYIPSLRLLLEEKVRGTSVKEILLGSDKEKQFEALERSATWLVGFHNLAPPWTSISPAEKQFARTERWTGRLAELGSPITEKAKQLFEKLKAEHSRVRDAECTPVHKDYSPDHVLLVNGRTAVIDWDGFDVGDPARDVARFVVAAQRLALTHLGSICALDWAVHLFLQTYITHRGQAVLPRLPFQRAATCVRMARHCAFNRQVPQWDNVAAMLDEGIRVLKN